MKINGPDIVFPLEEDDEGDVTLGSDLTTDHEVLTAGGWRKVTSLFPGFGFSVDGQLPESGHYWNDSAIFYVARKRQNRRDIILREIEAAWNSGAPSWDRTKQIIASRIDSIIPEDVEIRP